MDFEERLRRALEKMAAQEQYGDLESVIVALNRQYQMS